MAVQLNSEDPMIRREVADAFKTVLAKGPLPHHPLIYLSFFLTPLERREMSRLKQHSKKKFLGNHGLWIAGFFLLFTDAISL